MHPTGEHHLFLGSVPERIVAFGVLQLPFVIGMLASIRRMQAQGPVGPRFAGNRVGTITSASTLQNGTANSAATRAFARSDSRRGLIADHQGGLDLGTEAKQAALGITPEDKPYSALVQPGFELLQPLQHEFVMAQISMMGSRQQLKKNHRRFAQQVGGVDSNVQRRIILRALRTPHPVNHTTAVAIRSTRFAAKYSRIELQHFEVLHESLSP